MSRAKFDEQEESQDFKEYVVLKTLLLYRCVGFIIISTGTSYFTSAVLY